MNTQSQKTINLQRLGIQVPSQAVGLDLVPIASEFAHSTQNQHTKQLQPINGGQPNAQILYNQLIKF